MKHQFLFVLTVALCGVSPVFGATNLGARAGSSVDLTGAPATRPSANVNYTKYQTRTTTKTYSARNGNDMYYTQPVKRSDLYRQYAGGNTVQTARTGRGEIARTNARRKYFLAHPFFQPLKGKFGSVTDLSYAWSSYDVTLKPYEKVHVGEGLTLTLPQVTSEGTWKSSAFSIQEDLSYGITDRIALLGMLKYDASEYQLKWKDGVKYKDDDSGLNLFGLGAQWRFVDNDEWIATLSGYFQHQKDVANSFVLDLKGGYKIASTTLYGLVRGRYVRLIDGNAYGNGIDWTDENNRTAAVFLAFNEDVKGFVNVEGGVGTFSVLDEDWTLNFEAIYGYYDWHQQASLKAAIGWQPNDWFALNLYAKTVVYDSANGDDVSYWKQGTKLDNGTLYNWITTGPAKIDSVAETSVGLQAIFMF